MRSTFAALALFVCLSPCRAADPPLSGKAVPAYEPVDAVVLKFLTQLDATAATVAVSVDGKPTYSRGYGWLDQARTKPTPPDALFRIASVTKPITRAILMDLIAARKLRYDDKVLPLVGGTPADERWAKITVRHLIDHKGGFDATKSGDPMFRGREIRDALKLKDLPTAVQIIEYVQTRPLDDDPGDKEHYANFGFCVLGRVIEKVTKGTFADALERYVCRPIKTKDIRVARAMAANRDPREVSYPVPDSELPIEAIDAAGGLIASAPALCQFMAHFWLSGQRIGPGQTGDFLAYGSLTGTTAMARQRKSVDIAVLFNGRRFDRIDADHEALRKAIEAALDEAVKRPGKR